MYKISQKSFWGLYPGNPQKDFTIFSNQFAGHTNHIRIFANNIQGNEYKKRIHN